MICTLQLIGFLPTDNHAGRRDQRNQREQIRCNQDRNDNKLLPFSPTPSDDFMRGIVYRALVLIVRHGFFLPVSYVSAFIDSFFHFIPPPAHQ